MSLTQLSTRWKSVHPFRRTWSFVTSALSSTYTFLASLLATAAVSLLVFIAALTRPLSFSILLCSIGSGMIAHAACMQMSRAGIKLGVGVGLVVFGGLTLLLRVGLERSKSGSKGGEDGDEDDE